MSDSEDRKREDVPEAAPVEDGGDDDVHFMDEADMLQAEAEADAAMEDAMAAFAASAREGAAEHKDGEDGEEEYEDVEDGEEQEFRLADLTGATEPRATLSHHSGPVYSVAICAAKPSTCAVGSGDDSASMVNVETATLQHSLQGHTDTVILVAFNHSGTMLATGCYDGTVKIWDAETGELQHTLEGPGDAVEWVCWHPKGDVVAAGSADMLAWMWDARSGECLRVFSGHSAPVTAGVFNGTGKFLVTGDAEGSLRVWDPRTGDAHHVFEGREWHEDGINTLAVQPDSPLVLTGSLDGTARLCHVGKKKVVGVFRHSVPDEEGTTPPVESVGFCAALPWVATVGIDGKVKVWDTSTLAVRHVMAHEDVITALKWHPRLPLLYTTSTDRSLRAWDARSGKCVEVFGGHTHSVLALDVVEAEGRDLIVTGCDDSAVRLFFRTAHFE